MESESGTSARSSSIYHVGILWPQVRQKLSVEGWTERGSDAPIGFIETSAAEYAGGPDWLWATTCHVGNGRRVDFDTNLP